MFTHSVEMDPAGVLDLALSRSSVATQPPERRETLLAAAAQVLNRYGGTDGLQLPYRTYCYRAEIST